jgi:TrmH family RNA methyltransferase
VDRADRPSGAGRAGHPDEVLRSTANPTLAFVRSLQRRDVRARERAFVVEGRRAVADALALGAVPRLVLLREGDETPLPARFDPRHGSVRVVAERPFNALTETVAPQGILAVFPFPEPAPPAPGAAPLALVLDRIRDPGNLGTLLRSAAAAAVTAVYLSAASVDPFNPKVVRAGMGAHFRVPLRPLDPETAAEVRRDYPLRVLSAADAPTRYDALDWRGAAAVIVGSEAEGVGPEAAALATARAAIPLAAGVESLNAAVAGSVLLFEAVRQRGTVPP